MVWFHDSICICNSLDYESPHMSSIPVLARIHFSCIYPRYLNLGHSKGECSGCIKSSSLEKLVISIVSTVHNRVSRSIDKWVSVYSMWLWHAQEVVQKNVEGYVSHKHIQCSVLSLVIKPGMVIVAMRVGRPVCAHRSEHYNAYTANMCPSP